MTAPGGYQQPEQVNPIQLLSVLAGIQQSRRASDLADRQFEEGKQEFARQMGFNEKSAEYKKFADAIDLYSRSTTEGRQALSGLGEVIFPGNQGMQALLQRYGQDAPQSLEALRQHAANVGYQNAGQQGQGQMNLEAATNATTGMNQGGMQGSGLQALIAQQGQGQVTPEMGQDAAQFTANRQNPLEALLNRTITRNPKQVTRMADIQSGGMSPTQQAQVDIGRGGVEAEFAKLRQDGRYQEMEIATKLLTAKQQGAFTPSDMMAAYGRLAELQKNITDPKADEAARKQALAAYNSLANIMKAAGIATGLQYGPEGGGSAGTGQKVQQFIQGTTQTPSPPTDLNQQSSPFMSTPWNPAASTGNPLNPYLNPRRP